MKKFIDTSSLSNYFVWLLKEYQALFNTDKDVITPLKIIEKITCKKTSETLFKVQFTGKQVCPVLKASEIYADKKILKNFSKDDMIQILETVNADRDIRSEGLELYSISSITFDKQTTRPIYSLRFKDQKISFIKNFTASEIKSNKSIITGLDKQSIAEIAYQAGKESLFNDKT